MLHRCFFLHSQARLLQELKRFFGVRQLLLCCFELRGKRHHNCSVTNSELHQNCVGKFMRTKLAAPQF